jgi:HK97 family phage portal protein
MTTQELARELAVSSTARSGQSVSVETALRVSTVLACQRVLAEGIAQIPLKLYREAKNGKKEPATDHPLYDVLWRRPNDWMTSFEWRETSMYHAGLAKGAYAFANKVRGRTVELLPLVPGNVTVKQDAEYGVTYEIRDAKSNVIGEYGRDEVFHLRGPSWNGYVGMEMVRQAREAIGLAMATEESQALLHKNGARAGGILSFPNKVEEEGKKAIAAAWQSAFGGGNQFGTAVLDLGAKYERLAMTGVDAQHLETRKHQVEEICRIFRVFPLLVGYSDKTATFASAEQFFIAHVVHSLGPWIERFEQAIDRDLLSKKDRDEGYFAKFNVNGLLRGDATARSNYFKAMLGTSSSPGWGSPNDVRRLEDMDPSDDAGADEILTVEKLAGKAAAEPDQGGGGERTTHPPPWGGSSGSEGTPT